MTRSQPFSIRLGEAANLLVGEEARRTGRSRNAVVEELAEEAAKMRLFPGIAFRGRPRRAWVIGTGLDVWEIIQIVRAHDGAEVRVRKSHPQLGERQLRLAQTYAQRFPEEITQVVGAVVPPLDDLLTLYPFLERGDG